MKLPKFFVLHNLDVKCCNIVGVRPGNADARSTSAGDAQLGSAWSPTLKPAKQFKQMLKTYIESRGTSH